MAIFIVSTASVAFLGGGRIANQTDKNSETTITGTPADNYQDSKRPTFCETGPAKSSKYITEFKIPTACTQPLAIITDKMGNVWFTESNTGNLGKFDSSARTFQEFSNSLWQKGEKSMMWGLASSQDENIWFTDSQHNLLWSFNPTDKSYKKFIFPKSPTQEGSFPQKIFSDGNEFYVNDFTGKKIVSFNTAQTSPELQMNKIESQGDYNFTSTVVSDTVGNLWYTTWKYQEGGNLVSFDKNHNNFTKYALPLDIQAPNGITVDATEKLWIMDTASSYYFNFDPSTKQYTKYVTSTPQASTYGNASGLIKTPISRPYWNHFDEKGRLWFNEQVANSLGVYDPVKQTLVEYLIPSKNPNWSDCGTTQDCGVSQVLEFTVQQNKVWFTEWVENNIGLLDADIPLPLEVNASNTSLDLQRGQNATIDFIISPKEKLSAPISIMTATTAGYHNIMVTPKENTLIADKQRIVKVDISSDKFALAGNYKILLSARYNDVTISKYVTLTLE